MWFISCCPTCWKSCCIYKTKLRVRWGIRPPKGRGGAGPGSGVEEAQRAPRANVPYRARSSLTGLVAIAAR
jgi:hypothetical protein